MNDSASRRLRIGDLSSAIELPIKTLRRLADQAAIPSERTVGGHRVFDLDAVRASLSGSLPLATVVPAGRPDWSGTFPLRDLDEAALWALPAGSLAIDQGSAAGRIGTYAFTEMVNNAIDHSGGTSVVAEVWSSEAELAFRVTDDGEGVFAHLRNGLKLENLLDAAGELTKGKRTTWSERHTGEGIFFTSKAVGVFRISANGFRMTVDNARADSALGVSSVRVGSVIEVSIPVPSPHDLRSVFESFTNDAQRFTRTRPSVKLFGSGVTFVSRSEARRLMTAMEVFDDIDIDFAGVEDVGQGFVDEILRVWPSQHPTVRVTPINMNEAVEFMVRRADPDSIG